MKSFLTSFVATLAMSGVAHACPPPVVAPQAAVAVPQATAQAQTYAVPMVQAYTVPVAQAAVYTQTYAMPAVQSYVVPQVQAVMPQIQTQAVQTYVAPMAVQTYVAPMATASVSASAFAMPSVQAVTVPAFAPAFRGGGLFHRHRSKTVSRAVVR